MHTGFSWVNLRETEHVEDQRINDTTILSWIFSKWDGGMNCIDLAQNRGRWRVPVNAVMNFRVPQNAVGFLTR